jgi:hypothetical protein
MFFIDDDGVNVVQFGTGDISISPGLIKDSNNGSVSLIPQKPQPINARDDYLGNRIDTDLGVHTRLVFTDSRSIDVLVNMLEASRELMDEGLKLDKIGFPKSAIILVLIRVGNAILKLSDYLRK